MTRRHLRSLHRQRACLQAARAAQDPAPATSSSNAPALEQEADVDPTAYYENRLANVQQAKDSGSNPYPHKFHVDYSIPEFVDKFGKEVKNGEQMDLRVAVAGRVRTKRPSGSKLVFYDLVGDGAKVQIMASLAISDLAEDADAFVRLHNSVKRGDIVGVVGHPGASKNGELSIFPVSMQVRPPRARRCSADACPASHWPAARTRALRRLLPPCTRPCCSGRRPGNRVFPRLWARPQIRVAARVAAAC